MKWKVWFSSNRGRGFLASFLFFKYRNNMTKPYISTDFIRRYSEINIKHKKELQKIANRIERLEKEIQTNKIDADSGAFLIIQARRRVGQILTA